MLEQLLEHLQSQPSFDQLLGLELLTVEPETEVTGRVPVRPQLLQAAGIVHGGVYAAIAEALSSLGTFVGAGGDKFVAGMSNNTSFLRPITEGTVNARAVPLHRGRTTWVWDCELRDDDGRLCATSRVTIAVRQPR